MALLKNLDLLILAAALPVFAIAGLPLLGWVTALAVWAMWRGIGELTERRAATTRDPRQVAGLAAGSMIGRGWLLGLTLVGVGLAAGDDVGLSAAVLCVVLFTASFTTRLALRPFEPGAGGGTSVTP